MKKLLNTLYVLTPDSYLFCRNETICVKIGEDEKVSIPALSVDSIVCFGKNTVSTPLIAFCAERGISLVFLSEHGRFIARVEGPVSGNVLLRTRQYESLDDRSFSAAFVRSLLMAKLRNSKTVLLRSARNEESGDTALYDAAGRLSELAKSQTVSIPCAALKVQLLRFTFRALTGCWVTPVSSALKRAAVGRQTMRSMQRCHLSIPFCGAKLRRRLKRSVWTPPRDICIRCALGGLRLRWI